MNERSRIVLEAVLRVLRPAARLLLRNGVTYTALAAALKRVFLEAAQDELAARGMPQTDSALTLLSGVHRRDVRTLLRGAPEAPVPSREPLSLASQVVARWMLDPAFHDGRGRPRPLGRGGGSDSFDGLVHSVSSDVRPRAVLEELKRLGSADEDEQHITLLTSGFAPRQGLREMSWLFADNLHDHMAAAAANLHGEGEFLEQSVFVDQISKQSAELLHRAAARAWKQAFKTVMSEAQARFDHDAEHTEPQQRTERARFGAYFFTEQEAAKP